MAIDITRDAEGLRIALSELLEESFARARVMRSLESSDDDSSDRIHRSLPPLTLSPGYYKRAQYLLLLEKLKETGLIASGYTLSESEGLIALAEARAAFERSHPPCGLCSAYQDSQFETSCYKCGTQFLKRSA